MPRYTQAELARRVNASQPRVSIKLRQGFFSPACSERDESGKIWITDIDQAVKEWNENIDRTRAPAYIKDREAARVAAEAEQDEEDDPFADIGEKSPPATTAPEGTVAFATEREKHWKALLAEMKFREHAGELVLAKEVTTAVADRANKAKTKLLGIPSRARQAMPHLTVEDLATLEELIRECLEELVPQ